MTKPQKKLVLSHLLCLQIDYPAIFDDLTLPSLQTLELHPYAFSSTILSQFLKRSSPPLQKLVLGDRYSPIGVNNLVEWFRMVPSLTDLELDVADRETSLEQLFSALADSSSQLLPHLHTLKISHDFPALLGSSYRTLLRALSSRRSQLVSFSLMVTYRSKPTTDVSAELRQLVAGGMNIHIGTSQRNFISA